MSGIVGSKRPPSPFSNSLQRPSKRPHTGTQEEKGPLQLQPSERKFEDYIKELVGKKDVDNSKITLDNLALKDLTLEALTYRMITILRNLCPDLQSLTLEGITIEDDAFSALRGLKKFDCLTLRDCCFRRESGINSISCIENLTKLEMNNIGILDTDLEHITKHTKLESLLLLDCPKIEGKETWLKNLSDSLKILKIYNCPSFDNYEGLGLLVKLNSLGVGRVKDDDLKFLQQLTELTTLNLSGTKIDGKCHVYIKKLTQLKNLDLSGTDFNDAALVRLMDMNIESLDIQKCMKIKGSSFQFIFGTLKELKSLELGSYDFKIPREHIKHVFKLPNLIHLKVASPIRLKGPNELLDDELKDLAQGSAKTLETLFLEDDLSEDEDGGLSLLQEFKKLRSLTLKNHNVSNQALHHISKIKSLEELELYVLDEELDLETFKKQLEKFGDLQIFEYGDHEINPHNPREPKNDYDALNIECQKIFRSYLVNRQMKALAFGSLTRVGSYSSVRTALNSTLGERQVLRLIKAFL